ncbi:DNA mismatch repair endonuclease MutL [Leptobacterium flavescens]|uniref:DNA mismatch repair protein MutL n=1 Tax=Leptobacterium flavescens TaxID=472055 RepID=A0A6P0UHN9_9FLAO|nr:DNA mismatch repair endonuclease MutL [Leptobacterium flavescens]NER12142.1 DNA mismatch repair endonuclease MutL [Leptobacterium flavescens]
MADIIQLLPDHVANQIAAGEVVQRPASVVKELVENAIDAGSSSIKLVVKDGGKTLIQVIDNGVGMSHTDARLSFERHATSKIRSAEDLFQLNTKGFRGEALASIAAIAHVEMNTRQETEELGTQIRIEGGKLVSQEVTTTPEGTSISVKNLFFNIPARRNFLKSNQVELRHIIDEFQRVALAHPGVHFEMYHNGNELFALPVSNLRPRIVHIFGTKTNEKLVPVEENTEVVKISGFIGKPQFAKKSRGEQFFFVNNRFIKSPYLHHAILSAFEGLIKEQTYPSYFLYLEVDPTTIDINIHPTKTEIKFDDEHTLYAILRSAVKHSLGQFNIAPVLDFERDSNLDTPYDFKDKGANFPTIEVDSNFNPFEEKEGKVKTQTKPVYKKENTAGWESLYVGLETGDTKEEQFTQLEVESEHLSGNLFPEEEEKGQTTASTYQMHRKYIVTSIKSGMVIIDQYRAHQRILYEQFLRNITVKEALSQQLLFPLVLNYSKTETVLIKELKESLQHTGFAFSKIEDESIEITGIPMNVSESEVSIILDQLLADFQEEIPDSSFSQADLLAKTLSKALAVKTGELLQKESQEALVNDLFACKEPTLSPLNKPTYITITGEELDKKFL